MLNIKNTLALTISLSAMVLISRFALAAGTVPICINNKVTLPGQNGPEIWSCLGSGHAAKTQTTQQVPTNNTTVKAHSDDNNLAAVSVEPRSDATSGVLENEINRVLEQTRKGDKNTILKQLSMGIQYGSNRRDKGLRDNRGRSVIIPIGLQFQLTDRTSVSATVPLIHKESESVSSSGVYNTDAAGVGDVSLNATTTLQNETSTRPSISFNVGVGAPTGKIENPQTSSKLSVGSGFWTTSLGATISKRFDPATIFASARYQYVFSDKQFGYEVKPGNSLEYSYGLGFSINNALSVSGHIAGSIHQNALVDGELMAGSNSEPLEFASTSSLRLSKSSRLESNLAFGLNKDAEDARFGLTLSRDF